MSEHTPGPWYATASSPDGCVYSHDHELIVPWSPLQSDRRMANARLIAAAPEILDALQDASDALWTLAVHFAGPKRESMERIIERSRTLLARIEA